MMVAHAGRALCLTFFALSSVGPRLAAQTCMGRPSAADVKFALGISRERHVEKTAVMARLGAQFGRAFVSLGGGPLSRGNAAHNAQWQSLIGTTFGETEEGVASWCPVVRLDFSSATRAGPGGDRDASIEAGLSVGWTLSVNDFKQVNWRADVGLRHRVRKFTLESDGTVDDQNVLVFGTGISAIVKRVVAFDWSIRLPIALPGAFEPIHGLGMTIGLPRVR